MQTNPFTVRGMIQQPNDFIGRKAEVQHIITRLCTMQSCSVVGERRIGKSSLLYHLFQTGNKRLADDSFRFVYIELTDACAQTVVDFLRTILTALDLPSTGIADENKPNRNLVVFDQEIKKLSSDGTKVVLCLDEFEGVFLNPQEFTDGFFNHLRSMINQRRLALVTASREKLEIYAIDKKLTSPFFNLLSITELGEFKHNEVEAFFDHYQPLVQFTQQELEFINWYSKPHPLKLMIFCDVLLQRREQAWDNDETLEEIAKAYEILGGTHEWRKWRRNVKGIFSGESISKWLSNLKSLRDLGTGK